MVDIVKIDHVSDGLAQLPSQWDNSPNVRGMLTSWLRPLNDFEDSLIDVRDGFNVFTAYGYQLDIIATYFDIYRRGMSDDDLRKQILSAITVGNGSGTIPEMMSLFSSIANAPTVKYWLHPPLSFTLLAVGGNEGGSKDASYLDIAKAAGTEFAAIMYDPYQYCWYGFEARIQQDQLVDDLGNDLIDDLGNKLVANIIVDGVQNDSKCYSFIDSSEIGVRYSWLAESSVIDNTEITYGGNGFVKWAEDREIDPVTGSQNKARPPLQIANSGMKADQPMSRQYFNWLIANIDEWLYHFSNRTAVGTIKMTTLNYGGSTEEYELMYGGTWVTHGSATFCGETVYVFERTA